MKKSLIVSIIFLILGTLLGIRIYAIKNNYDNVFNENNIYYFLQEGVYLSKDIMKENTKNLDAQVVEYNNNKYYVYVGITKEENVARKMKNIYEKMGYQIYIKEINLINEEFDSNMCQYDLLMKSTEKKDELLTIMEVVLANYEEMVQRI